MKSLSEFIKEELDTAEAKRIAAQRVVQKKRALVAVKKAMQQKDEADLKNLADAIYAEIANYKNQDDFIQKLEAGDIDSGWQELYDNITKANTNNEVDINTILDVIEKISLGLNLDKAIAEVAKKTI